MLQEEFKKNLLEKIETFKNKKILVIGDSILDKYIYGTALGLSLETPTLKGKKEKIEYSFGGAGNVVENILELGSQCTFITLLGEDSESLIYNNFKNDNLELIKIIEKNRFCTIKERHYMSKGTITYKVLQWDQLDNKEISTESVNKVLHLVNKLISSFDMVLLIDYRHGMMSKFLIHSIIEISKQNKKKIIASSQVSESKSNHLDYSGSDLIVMNKKEAESIDENFSEKNIQSLANKLNSDVCVTFGNKGSILYYKGKLYFKSSIKVNEVDSCGAGDSFLAAFSVSGLDSPESSLEIANIWAGLSVLVQGAKPPKKQELIDYINKM
ncbi:MAG: PfkB family carbohydrate kinase [Candidatus Pacearchaeota archaeon]